MFFPNMYDYRAALGSSCKRTIGMCPGVTPPRFTLFLPHSRPSASSVFGDPEMVKGRPLFVALLFLNRKYCLGETM